MTMLTKHLKFDCSEHLFQNSDNRIPSAIIIMTRLLILEENS